MTGFVLVLSGGIGAGKSSLAEALKVALQADNVSFGDGVRAYAEKNGIPTPDRAMLQELGQALVLTKCTYFVESVLAQAPAQSLDDRLIVQGVRHIEVLWELKRQLSGRQILLVHIETPSLTREERVMKRDSVDRRDVARYDNDITEAQVLRILPQYAHFRVNGELPTSLQVAEVCKWLVDIRLLELTAA